MRCCSRRLAAWLGLLAMLLAVWMPVASQVAARALSSDAPCSAAAHERAGHPAEAAAELDPPHLDACGYCGLFAHIPAVLHAARGNAGVPSGHLFVAPRRAELARRLVRYARRPSRAPPVDA